MRRFLVLQSFHVNSHKEHLLEPVIDFDSLEAAQDWINEQQDPSSFETEDLLAEESHDYDYYDLSDENRYYNYHDLREEDWTIIHDELIDDAQD